MDPTERSDLDEPWDASERVLGEVEREEPDRGRVRPVARSTSARELLLVKPRPLRFPRDREAPLALRCSVDAGLRLLPSPASGDAGSTLALLVTRESCAAGPALVLLSTRSWSSGRPEGCARYLARILLCWLSCSKRSRACALVAVSCLSRATSSRIFLRWDPTSSFSIVPYLHQHPLLRDATARPRTTHSNPWRGRVLFGGFTNSEGRLPCVAGTSRLPCGALGVCWGARPSCMLMQFPLQRRDNIGCRAKARLAESFQAILRAQQRSRHQVMWRQQQLWHHVRGHRCPARPACERMAS